MANVLVELGSLETELQRAKDSLKDVDENIKKLTGRDPLEKRSNPRRVSLGAPIDLRGRPPIGSPPARSERRTRALSGPGERGNTDIRGRLFALARQGIDDSGEPQVKRRIVGGAFSRLGPSRQRHQQDSDEEEETTKPTIQSSIVPAPGVNRTRKESIDQQNKDEKGKARNRRMFGLLLGTLQKFRTEAKETKEKDDQRRKIEVKLEDKAKQEKDDAIKERQTLFKERRERQAKVALLEQKMELVNTHEIWETETKKLKNFLRTKAEPHLFYKPRHLSSSDSRVKETHKAIDELIKSRKRRLEETLEEMTMSSNGREDDNDDKDNDEVEESGKQTENKENRKRKGERKRHTSREAEDKNVSRRMALDPEDDLVEEEDAVSVSGEVKVDDSETRNSKPDTVDTEDNLHPDTEMKDDERAVTLKSEKQTPEQQDEDKHPQTNDNLEEDDVEQSTIDRSRRVVLAEDEEESSMDQSAAGYPEQADE